MIRAAICDDEKRELARLSALLGQYQADRAAVIQYDAFASVSTLLDAMRHTAYDLLLLDILMPGLNGMQAAREIRQFNREAKIIFLTSSPEFAVESYAVDAYSYLLKPATADKLFPVLDKLAQAARRAEKALTLSMPSGIVRLPISRIEFLEVCNKRLMFHIEDGSVRELSGAMSDFENILLSHPEFIKVHRSYLVNMEHIQTLDAKGLVTYTRHRVPISRLLYPQVRERYMNFLFAEKGVE